MPAQLFAFAPGSKGAPKRIERYFTIVKAGNLDVKQLKARQTEADVAIMPKSQNKVTTSLQAILLKFADLQVLTSAIATIGQFIGCTAEKIRQRVSSRICT